MQRADFTTTGSCSMKYLLKEANSFQQPILRNLVPAVISILHENQTSVESNTSLIEIENNIFFFGIGRCLFKLVMFWILARFVT